MTHPDINKRVSFFTDQKPLSYGALIGISMAVAVKLSLVIMVAYAAIVRKRCVCVCVHACVRACVSVFLCLNVFS